MKTLNKWADSKTQKEFNDLMALVAGIGFVGLMILSATL